MPNLPERWCALAPRWRVICWLAGTLILLLGWFVLVYHPARQQLAALEAQRSQASAFNAALWAAVRKASSSTEEAPQPVVAFTPLAFNHKEMRLVRWQPGSGGGELILEAEWGRIPALFTALTRHDVAVRQFSVEPQQSGLQVVLQLERRDGG